MENIYRYVLSDYDDCKPFSNQMHYSALYYRLRRAIELEKQQLEKQQSKNDAQQVDKSQDEEIKLKKLKRAKPTISTPEAAAVADQEAAISVSGLQRRCVISRLNTPGEVNQLPGRVNLSLEALQCQGAGGGVSEDVISLA